MMRVVVLGAGAGGGFPQWNCNCRNCRRARAGDPAAVPLTQNSLAVTADERRWVLFNASPDLRRQIETTTVLHPQGRGRNSPIAAAVLCSADVDHTAGLLSLRETQPLALYATGRVHELLAANAMFNVLHPDVVPRRRLPLDQPMELTDSEGTPLGLKVEAFAVPGTGASWLQQSCRAEGGDPEDVIGLKISDVVGEGHFFYIPGCAHMDPTLAARLNGAPLILFDGTTYADDEVPSPEHRAKSGDTSRHMSIAGPDGSLARLARLGIQRRIYVHIDNSNPILLADTLERRMVEAAGWEIGRDGMEIWL